MITDLFPFCSRCQQADDCLRDSGATGNDSCMVHELVCSHFEDEQGTDEGSNAVRDDVPISHNAVRATRRWNSLRKDNPGLVSQRRKGWQASTANDAPDLRKCVVG